MPGILACATIHGLCGAGCLTQHTLGKHSTISGTSPGVHSILSAQTHPTGITNVLAKMGKVPARLWERGFWTQTWFIQGASPSTSTKDMASCPAICHIELYGWRGGGQRLVSIHLCRSGQAHLVGTQHHVALSLKLIQGAAKVTALHGFGWYLGNSSLHLSDCHRHHSRVPSRWLRYAVLGARHTA